MSRRGPAVSRREEGTFAPTAIKGVSPPWQAVTRCDSPAWRVLRGRSERRVTFARESPPPRQLVLAGNRGRRLQTTFKKMPPRHAPATAKNGPADSENNDKDEAVFVSAAAPPQLQAPPRSTAPRESGVIISKRADAPLAPMAASMISKRRGAATLLLLQDLKAAVDRVAAADAALKIKFALDCVSDADNAPADFLPPGLIAPLQRRRRRRRARQAHHAPRRRVARAAPLKPACVA